MGERKEGDDDDVVVVVDRMRAGRGGGRAREAWVFVFPGLALMAQTCFLPMYQNLSLDTRRAAPVFVPCGGGREVCGHGCSRAP